MPTRSYSLSEQEVDFVALERDYAQDRGQPTVRRVVRASDRHSRQMSARADKDYDSDDEAKATPTLRRSSTTPAASPLGPPAFQITMTIPQPTNGALADNRPMETVVVSLQPPPRMDHDRDGRISQTTEHLLIAAGSIGATIMIVMIVFALYTMRKRGLTFSDAIRTGKDWIRQRRGPPPPPPKHDVDMKQPYDEAYMYGAKGVQPPRLAVKTSRSGSLATQTAVLPLGRADSFNVSDQTRKVSANTSFLIDETASQQDTHRRNTSATPSSPVLPIQPTRSSASTRNTRSIVSDEEAQRQPSPLPPPTFRQFLSGRPSISQRPGLGGGMMSRFSWTNSNAPQTPHGPQTPHAPQTPQRNTTNTPTALPGHESFMTTRSSVPRFRTIDSWVNQQSNRVEAQALKQQFRMTTSTVSSSSSTEREGDDDKVPEMPAVPAAPGLVGKNIRHQRGDTRTTIETAPIFKQHPGTEVRFSVRSEVPSEVLDRGRGNGAL